MITIHLISTGGTIEKIYSEQSGSVVNIEGKIERYLARLRLPDTEVVCTRVLNKDSLDMTDEDRGLVLDAVRQKLGDRAPIIISHGTDTMVQTGRFLDRHLTKPLAAPVILTGAMVPLGFEGTDGIQNLTESLLAAKLLPPGVYVVMHNQTFPVDSVRKDRDLGTFVRTA
ncbi:MAG: asparaginase [Bryobacteraceae bacterium]